MNPPVDAQSPRPWVALQTTLAVQIAASLALSAAPVLAPAVAPGLGIAPERVGLFVGMAYLFAMLSGLVTGRWVAALGATRVSQCVLLLIADGVVVATGGGAFVLLAAAALIGVGYGAVTPAAAAGLGRPAPAGSPGLFFALKQTGVPIGVGLAGLLMPLGLATIGWRGSAWLAAGAVVLLAVVLVPVVPRLDPRVATESAPVSAWTSLADAMRVPVLRRLSLVSLAFAMTQLGFLTFVVSLLHLERGMSLGLAAGLLAASQAVCTVMRVVMGHIADRWVSPRVLLGGLGLAMSASCLSLALLPRSAGLALTTIVVLACGATAMGWNGVYFAELIRNVPRERVAAAAGGTQFFTFGGSMLGPVLFGALVHLGGSYSLGYACFALLGLVAGGALLISAPLPLATSRPGS